MTAVAPDPARMRAVRAAIEFLSERQRWVTALRRHIPHADGRCSACQLVAWPCPTWRMARTARQLCETREARG